MTDPNRDIVRLSSRISALEKANRRYKLGGLFLFIILAAAAFLTGFKTYAQRSTTPHVPRTVAAHQFVLMGPSGRILGRMTVIHGKPALQFYDSEGRLWWFAPPQIGVTPARNK